MKLTELHKIFRESTGVTTDSRNINENNIFFALKGENFDGNKYAEEAITKGAKLVVIDNNKFFTNKDKMVLVEDALQTLQDLAKLHREYIGLPIIALTGSNGKTTTKELIQNVLQQKYNTQATIGNLNNHIGVPLTLLALQEDTDIGIVEMGANHQHEIGLLCSIAQPDFGYITNFGRAHLEGFGGFEGVVKGKSELYDYLLDHQKMAFINLDDELQVEKSVGIRQFGFSSKQKNGNNVYFDHIEAQPMATVSTENTQISSQLTGIYNAVNICAATTIGKFFGINLQEIKKAIENYTPNNNRSQWVENGSNKILLDAYNANPSSMKAALTNFFQLQYDNKLLILGDMFELGQESRNEHQLIVDLVSNSNIPAYFVGKEFYQSDNNNEKIKFFDDFDALKNHLRNHKITNQTILIKGSRGMQLERALEFL